MSFYSDLAVDVDELLVELGQTVVVTSFELGDQDPDTAVVTQPSTQFNAVGVLLDYDYRNFGESTVSYQAVSANDKRLLLSATNVVKTGDLVYVDSAIYKCHVVKCVNPAGERVLYDIWIQK